MPQYLSRFNSSGLSKAARQARRRALDRERRTYQENLMAEARAAIASKVPLAVAVARPEKVLSVAKIRAKQVQEAPKKGKGKH
jgi:hypothetical protein